MTQKRHLKLKTVLGITSQKFGIDIQKDKMVYTAGATVITFDYERNQQIDLFTTPTPTIPISCLSFNSDHSILAVGEVGHQPRILLFQNQKLIDSLTGHKYGILLVSFSPDDRYLVSIGHQHDGSMYIWDYRNKRKLGVKISVKIHSLCFDPTGRFFVTVGAKHVKFWDLSRLSMDAGSIEGTSAVLGEHKSLTWVDVQCLALDKNGRQESYTFVVSDSGILIMLNESFVQQKWLFTKMDRCSCIAATQDYIICGGSDGKIRIFHAMNLSYVGSVPLPDPMEAPIPNPAGHDYPQAMTIKVTQDNKLIVLYSNRNIVIFESQYFKNYRMLRNLKFHCDCIWGILPTTTPGQDSVNHSFITYSQDGLVRFWNSECLEDGISGDSVPYLMDTLVADPTSQLMYKKIDPNGSTSNMDIKNKNGVRSFALDPTGKLLACGDRHGTLKFFLFKTFELLQTVDAHDGEIMDLCFALVGAQLILASAGRDRLIHIFGITFDGNDYEFDLLQTLDDHTSTLTCMMFLDQGHKLVSCGADKSIIFRSLQNDGAFAYTAYRNTPLRSTIYDMACSPDTRTLIAISQDRKMTYLNIDSGKPERSTLPNIKLIENSKGNPFLNSLAITKNGSVIIASSSDKTVHVIDPASGNSIHQGLGHGDLITDVVFLNQGTHVASVSGDGCIFIWKVSDTIKKRIDPSSVISTPRPNSVSPPQTPAIAHSPASVFRFDESTLPAWARSDRPADDVLPKQPVIPPTQGRWAERVENKGIVLFSEIPLEQTVVATREPARRFSFETSYPSRHTLPEMKPSESSEYLDISIHDVEPIISRAGSVETIPVNPFADTIETDSEDAMEEILQVVDVLPQTPNRNSLSLKFLQSPRKSANSSPISFSIAPSNTDAPTPPRPISSSYTPSTVMSKQELLQFELLAEKATKCLSTRTRESIERVHQLTSRALGQESLLHDYSERLVEMVRQKLANK